MSTCSVAILLADFHLEMLKASEPIHEEPSLHFHLELQLIQDEIELFATPHLAI